MDVSVPLRAVIPSAHGPVLTVLARAGTPLTGRQVAELTSPPVSQKQVATILRDLADSGLVAVTPAGRANLHELNRDHLAAEAIDLLVTIRERLWERMVAHAATWAHSPRALVVFGSAARGDGATKSDIDVLAVRPTGVPADDASWQADLTRFVDDVTSWTGNSVDLLDLDDADLRQMADAGEALLSRVRAEGRFLIGARHNAPSPREV
ncbi:nucleotidyltransferase domain-containing protein [Cellulomonas xiejunii]|uniref:Nucleotidyltransferase domain-containing protein n=1 Tax=Cellulomonas xiejunii TaxID=2968083 RepID=A0ABY5KS89_9CELL|nr:nucleotidyltransferase domain-containing protein [Cellulomonas xiejunii]MCC2322612.1 nucleotidyltransferase domain-containing protein [Cellulomonas xiejunii]UUI72645.1 nucleotidyltransferase domain-containing protein [Cellulomonas xiejunii]